MLETGKRETDGGSAPAVSQKARGLARSRAHNRRTGTVQIRFQRDVRAALLMKGIQ